MRTLPPAVVIGLVVAFAGDAQAGASVELVTMGRGDDLFSLFGHAAMCVLDPGSPHQPTCYNYGTTDFTRPAGLAADFLRGDALFWVSIAPRAGMLRAYASDDRSVHVQRMPWPEPEVQAVSARLARDADRRQGAYVYEHFGDNCTTRLRDIINDASGGALRRSL